MARRQDANKLNAPMSFYEVHLGAGPPGDDHHRWMTYREMAHELVDYAKEMGFTHVELLPVTEHPFSAAGATRRSAIRRHQPLWLAAKISCTSWIIAIRTAWA